MTACNKCPTVFKQKGNLWFKSRHRILGDFWGKMWPLLCSDFYHYTPWTYQKSFTVIYECITNINTKIIRHSKAFLSRHIIWFLPQSPIFDQFLWFLIFCLFLSFQPWALTPENYQYIGQIKCGIKCDPSRQKGHVVGKHCFEI